MAKKIDTTKLEMTEGFICRPENLYEAFTNEKMISAYHRAAAKIDLKVGGEYSMFDGNLTGTYKELSVNKIVMTFRFREWPDDVTSMVTMKVSLCWRMDMDTDMDG